MKIKMDDEMIDRVAEAIYNNWANYPTCLVSKSWEDVCKALPGQANDFRRKAKAAIKAMREPTEKMVNAADVPVQADFYPPDMTWQMMIDCILND